MVCDGERVRTQTQGRDAEEQSEYGTGEHADTTRPTTAVRS